MPSCDYNFCFDAKVLSVTANRGFSIQIQNLLYGEVYTLLPLLFREYFFLWDIRDHLSAAITTSRVKMQNSILIKMFNPDKSLEIFQLKYIQENWRALDADTDATRELQSSTSEAKCTKWVYDTSEFKDTAVTDNDWVCDKVSNRQRLGV